MRLIRSCRNFHPALRWVIFGIALMCGAPIVQAQLDQATNTPPPSSTNRPPPPAKTEDQVRGECIEGRRMICGRVVQVSKEGLVVESGYTELTRPPLDKTWVVRGNVVALKPDPHLVEQSTPGAPCVGLVFLTDTPKRPTPKKYDYVVLLGYPAGTYVYKPVPTVQKTIRKFTGSIAGAVALRMKEAAK
jgi:hypothetical protein